MQWIPRKNVLHLYGIYSQLHGQQLDMLQKIFPKYGFGVHGQSKDFEKCYFGQKNAFWIHQGKINVYFEPKTRLKTFFIPSNLRKSKPNGR